METGTLANRVYFDVRDYECDMQGIVNNAVYQNYLEHARHQFIKDRGLDFADITQQGIHLVLIKAELDYKHSLKSGDAFYVEIQVERLSRLKLAFHQQVFRSIDNKLMLNAKMTITSTNKAGRPIAFEYADVLLNN